VEEGLSRGWKQSGRFVGTYNDYVVQGIRFDSPNGEIGWVVASWPILRSTIHDFWVSDGTLFRFGTHPVQSLLNHQPMEIAEKATNVDPKESKAVLMAVEDWQRPVPKYTDWNDYDPTDAATHPKDRSKVEIQFENGRVVEGFYGGGMLGTVGFVNLTSEEETGLTKRWRYIEDPDEMRH